MSIDEIIEFLEDELPKTQGVLPTDPDRKMLTAEARAIIAAILKLQAVVEAARLAEQHLNAYQMKDTGLTDALAALDENSVPE